MKKIILLLLFIPLLSFGQGLNGYEYVYVKSKNYDIANGVMKNDFYGLSNYTNQYFTTIGYKVLNENEYEEIKSKNEFCKTLVADIKHTEEVSYEHSVTLELYDCKDKLVYSKNENEKFGIDKHRTLGLALVKTLSHLPKKTNDNLQIEDYFDDGKRIIEKTWKDEGQTKTLIETIEDGSSGFRYFINDSGIEVGALFYQVNDYGNYFKVDMSIINDSDNRIDFKPENIKINVNGEVKKKEKYKALSFKEYKSKVERRQGLNMIFSGLASGLSNANSGYTYSTSQSTNWDAGYPQITTTTTQSYSPALANMQAQQNQRNLIELENSQNDRMNFINEGYLKNHTLFPYSTLEGYILIPFHKKVTDIDLVLKIGDKEFDFGNDKWH